MLNCNSCESPNTAISENGRRLDCLDCGRFIAICPNEDCRARNKIKFIDKNLLHCDGCGKDFEPPQHLRNRGSKPQKMPLREFEERPQPPDFDWYLNDLIIIAKQRLRTFPISPFEELCQMIPSVDSLRTWAKHLDDLDLEVLEDDWRAYLHNWKTLDEVASVSHVYNSILKESEVIVLKTEPCARALAYAIRERLPKEKEIDESKLDPFIDIETAAILLKIKPDSVRKKAQRVGIEKHPHRRGFYCTKDVLAHRDGKK